MPHATRTHSTYFLLIAILFVATLMISNTVAGKLVQIGPFIFAGAIFFFPISYIFGDVLTEVYGYRASRTIIWAGFFALVAMSLSYYVVQLLPAPPFWQHQAAYEAILGTVPRIVLGSIVAYLVGEFCNSYVLSRLKVRMQGKKLYVRTIGSTIVGEGVDTLLFSVIAFAGTIPLAALSTMILSSYLCKVLYEVLATPVTYAIVRTLKRVEGVDVYDRNISYTPFTLSE